MLDAHGVAVSHLVLGPWLGRRREAVAFDGVRIASLKGQRLAYRSHSRGRLDRLQDKAEKLWPPNRRCAPRGRNRERLFAGWSEADEAFETLFAVEVTQRFRRLQR